jgi:hypothetical protein
VREKANMYRFIFRVIRPQDYHTPLGYIPVEESCHYGDTEQDAKENFFRYFYGVNPDYIRFERIEIVTC